MLTLHTETGFTNLHSAGILAAPDDDFACGCAACAGGLGLVDASADSLGYVVGGLDASVDPLAGTTAGNGKPIWSATQAAEYLNRTGASWDPSGPNSAPQRGDSDPMTVTFGFHENQQSLFDNGYVYELGGGLYGLAEYFNFAPFSEAQREATREAIGYWDDLVALSFVETDSYNADMNYANLASAPDTQAYARLPGARVSSNDHVNDQVIPITGDVWVSASQASNFQLDEGGYGLNTLVHETGHALGLSHPGAYNFGPGFAVNYDNGAEYYQDVRNYSIMSYWNPRSIGARDFNFNVMSIAYGATPMVHDILAVQLMYGADMTTRTGDTVYGFNSTAGRDAFDFAINQAPTVAIWDAGGTDTLDASGYGTDQVIDLNPGSLSSIGGVTLAEAQTRLSFEQVNANRAAMGYAPIARATYDANMAALAANPSLGRLTDNVGIAYGAWIENAVGGSGNDVLVGNAVKNVLNGGAGIDTVSYRGATSGVSITVWNGKGSTGDAAGDIYISIERYEGSNFADVLRGGNGNADDWLSGLGGDDQLYGDNGDDTLFGGDGNDYVDGGEHDDYLDGGAGNDQLYGRNGKDVIFGGAGDDFIDGGEHDDTIDGGDGNDIIYGRNGKETITAGAGDDWVDGGEHDDVIDGGDGNDTLYGRNGKDVILGGAGNDFIDGGEHDDTLDGGDGNDILYGRNGKDTILGGAGDDYLDGAEHDDWLDGGAGNDRLFGGNNRDVLLGGAGDDWLDGGQHDDILNGGAGADTMTGGANRDIFQFTDADGALDRILDFKAREDKIDLSQLDAVDGGGLDHFSWIGSAQFSGTSGELRSYSANGAFYIAGDTDGDGIADLFVQTNVLIAHSDLILA